ncbi:MAG: glycosyltransferase family 2 protein [Roseimicrobium sp.]
MSDSPPRCDSLLAAAQAANALLLREYKAAQCETQKLRQQIKALTKEIEGAKKNLETAQKRPLRLLVQKIQRELTRPFRRQGPANAARKASAATQVAKPSKAERRALAWEAWIRLPDELQETSAAFGWEVDPAWCQALMERTTQGDSFLFAGCSTASLVLASLLEAKGCPATVMGAPPQIRKFSRETLRLETAPLAERLRYESEFTGSFQHVVIDGRFPDELTTLALLRLWPAQRIWLLHAPEDLSTLASIITEASAARLPGLLHYDHAPVALRHPDWRIRSCDGKAAWPTPTDAQERYEPTLPSGKPWPRITIATVTRNQAAYIRQTLDSVLAQEYPNLEYLVFDGASTDETPVILREYQPRLTYAVSEPDRGQSDALQKAFARSTGDILAWLNSDDLLLPGALRRVAMAFDAQPQADLLAGGCALFRDGEPQPYHVHHCRFPIHACSPLPLERVLDLDGAWFQGDFFMQPETFWRRSLWERAGSCLDTSLHYNMDYELFARFAAAGAVLYHVPESLCLFRMHAEQKTHGDDKPFVPEARRVREQLAARFLPNLTC